ncbi:hypothetical protein N568_0101065 [Lactococcus garvieae TRF1]|uniref:Gram-positive cocci surface proteins LPxTG domain-containing protein n=1 Tax=Lactococcus garvieae TRF1 TaxID=1380772 RepID=V8ASZ5_9LACT|nr:hypothetical protein N568_0101065 [Lactococcus garvieae TRF1]
MKTKLNKQKVGSLAISGILLCSSITPNIALATTEGIPLETDISEENIQNSPQQSEKDDEINSVVFASSEESLDSWMPDKSLQNSVFKRMKSEYIVGTITQINKQNISRLKTLYLDDEEVSISSLEGLQYATGLNTFHGKLNQQLFDSIPNYIPQIHDLSAVDSNISDISILNKMMNLTQLTLAKNDITDITPLAGLPLDRLELSYNKISDISALEKLPKLNEMQALHLRNNEISDVSALKNFNWKNGSNQSLDVSYNHILDISPISEKNTKISAFVNGTNQSVTLPSIEINSETYEQTILNFGIVPWNDYYKFQVSADLNSDGKGHGGGSDIISQPIIKWEQLSNEGNLIVSWNSRENNTTTVANHNGEFTGTIVQPYIKVIAGGDITAKYINEEGKAIAEDVVKTGNVGERYTTEQKDIDGYNFKEIQGNASGTFSDQPQEVIYVYERTEAAPVIVKYQDEEGNDLSPADTLNGKIGLPYESHPKSINGWTVKTTPSNASGTFSDQPQEVVYVYLKDTLIDTGTSVNTGTPNNTENPSNHEQNSSDTLLPSTGESKGLLFSIFGALLLILASLSIFLKKKSK